MTMRAGGQSGKSMSGINEKVFQNRGARSVAWKVRCYSIPDIFENYWGIRRPYKDVFLKIDVDPTDVVEVEDAALDGGVCPRLVVRQRAARAAR